MLFKKLLRTMGQYKAQFISMIIMIALGIGVFLGFNMEWYSIEKNTDKFYKDSDFADYRLVNEAGFSAADLDKIKNIDGVEAAGRYLSVNVAVTGKGDLTSGASAASEDKTAGDTLSISVTENKNVSFFILILGEEYDETSTDGLWLSDKYAKENGVSVGDEITLNYKKPLKVKVKGLIKSAEYLICVRDETQLMPDYRKYAFAFVSPETLKAFTGGMEYYPQINVISDMSKNDFSDKANEALEKTTLMYSKNEVISYSEAQGEVQEGKTMGSILPVLFLSIAVLTMVTTMHRLTAKEKTQIGTLKALGFKDKRITVHYTSYAFMIGVLGSLIGAGIGYGLAYFIFNTSGSMGTYFDMPEWTIYMPWFCILILIGIIALLTLIGFLSVRSMLKGTAADSLRPYTPKKMKKIALEKTKLWNKLSFGTKWNMRDIVRHKSRTLMSLIGILGCTIIILGSLGMSDTMDAFISDYYNGAMNYSSKIFLSETASEEDKVKIVEDNDGDYSMSLAVEIEDKAVSLDVYSVTNDRVRFPGKKKGYVDINVIGAFVCERIAEEYNVKKGDVLKVRPFGKDVTYELKISGIMRSVSENIVVSKEYAESLGIKVSPDAVYTSVKKEEVVLSPAIKNVQSSKEIMESFDTFMSIMNEMIIILVAAAAVLGTVVLYNLGVMSYTERYREMATLKVVGFKDKKIGGLLIGQNLWVTVVGVVLGLPAGLGVLNLLVTKLASEYELRPVISVWSYLIAVAVNMAVSLLVSLMVAKKNKKIDMVEALKFAE